MPGSSGTPDAAALRHVIDASLDAFGAVGAPSTWVLSNHDVVRHATRLSVTEANPQGHGLGPRSKGLPAYATGLRRARAATALMLALPGSSYLYQGEELGDGAPYWGQEGVHEIYRDWRALLDEYPGERILAAEAWVDPLPRVANWVRPDEMHQAFNFAYLETPWNAPALRKVVDDSLAAFGGVSR